MTFQYFRC